jgi:pimeloyl-ACP methyl ester carboxylesterase
VGRGQSDWLKDPMGYQVPTYAADMMVLLGQLDHKTLDWVGTSMGGLIGIVVSGQPDLPLSAPVRKLVLNDVGPVIEWQALQRIGQYLGNMGKFDTVQQAADALWAVSRSFGPHTPEQWLDLSKPMLKPWVDLETGGNDGFTLNYDPALALPFASMTQEAAMQGEALLWTLYDNIKAQTLIMRGVESDLLSTNTAIAMTQRGPQATLAEFTGVGHAPTFVPADQVQTAINFLLS